MAASTKTILISAGGTGGHLYPALAVAQELSQQGWQIVWLGCVDRIEAQVIPLKVANDGWAIDFIPLSISALRGRGLRKKLLSLKQLSQAVLKAAVIIRQKRPSVILGMGGFTAGAAGIAAFFTRVPLVIHEQNAIMGLTNKVLSKFAAKVLMGYPLTGSALSTWEWVGNPVRDEIRKVAEAEVKDVFEGQRSLRLLVMGGSLGAHTLNLLIPQVLVILKGSVEVWHQTGEQHLVETCEAYQQEGLKTDNVVPFINDMAQAYQWADLIIARSGAMTVAEVVAAQVPAIFVPYPYAVDDHQYFNALFVAQQGGAEVVRQEQLTVENVAAMLENFSTHPALLVKMKYNLKALQQTFGDVIANIINHCEVSAQRKEAV